ncbi:MAG: SPOR domain-containing protein [Gammaproteobacteria bacterium]|nr:SPOR domain-containing protein [Gammaproteobacteria bacterium]MCB1849426.1 SPOR domain-containing protein [Gammaproteobacteria bacterium]MCP5418561.1 SPOR domain-containing protein [Chromatiaceae bacterium]
MPRDYKSRANPPTKKRGAIPGWVWFIVGLLAGLFFSGLAWLKLLPAERQGAVEPSARRAPAKEEREVRGESDTPPKPVYEFYTILPEMEVVVPEPEPVPEPGAAPKSAANIESPREIQSLSERYMLQMGSFRKYADADRLKASLALVGIQAEIQKVKIDNGETFHRVRAGPYTQEKVKLLNAKLKQNRINSLMIKLK